MLNRAMKAKKIEKEMLREWATKQWVMYVVERKIDGFRFIRVKNRWASKQNKLFSNVKDIQHRLDQHRKLKGYIIDGELAGKSWEQTMTLFRSSKTDVSSEQHNGKYWVFDIVHPDRLDEPYRDRRKRLEDIFSSIDDPRILPLHSEQVLSYNDFERAHNEHLVSGGDGSILKDIFSGYEFKRSKSWLKVKPIHELDCKIVGFKEGKGKYVGTLGSIEAVIPLPKNKWSIETTNISGMTDEDRHYIWRHRKELIGKIVEVSYRKISEKDRLVEGRIHRLRLDKDML